MDHLWTALGAQIYPNTWRTLVIVDQNPRLELCCRRSLDQRFRLKFLLLILFILFLVSLLIVWVLVSNVSMKALRKAVRLTAARYRTQVLRSILTMSLHVGLQVRFSLKLFSTDFAHEIFRWFLMNVSYVPFKVRLQLEWLLTELALMRFCALMRYLMSFKVVKAFESLLANLAFMWEGLFSVSSLMLIESLYAYKLLITLFAFELVFHLFPINRYVLIS